MIKPLYSKHNFTDRNIVHLKNVVIREYDIRDAGMSIIKHCKILGEEQIAFLQAMPKTQKNIYIGNLMKEHPEFEIAPKMFDEYVRIRKNLFELNDIKDEEVLSIKKDAIFLVNKRLKVSNIDIYDFVEKSKFSSYINLMSKEFYYSSWNNRLVVKGFDKEVTKILLTRGNLFDRVRHIIQVAEFNNQSRVLKAIKDLRDDYIHYELPIDSYRDIQTNNFRLKYNIGGKPFCIDHVAEEMKEEIDIRNNYGRIILPLCKVLL